MTAKAEWHIDCDGLELLGHDCLQHYPEYEGMTTVEHVRDKAKEIGWRYVRFENRQADFCPKCVPIYKARLKAKPRAAIRKR